MKRCQVRIEVIHSEKDAMVADRTVDRLFMGEATDKTIQSVNGRLIIACEGEENCICQKLISNLIGIVPGFHLSLSRNNAPCAAAADLEELELVEVMESR